MPRPPHRSDARLLRLVPTVLSLLLGRSSSSSFPPALLFTALHWFLWFSADVSIARAASSSSNASSEVSVFQDDTPPCSHAWCHELACQVTHFGATVDSLSDYIAIRSPERQVRVYLWRPYQGPVVFDVSAERTHFELADRLSRAGHSSTDALYVAIDTLSTSLDLLSVPAHPTIWWLVRDGLGRELLRPVTRWMEPGGPLVLTINAHGQAYALAHSPEVGRLARIPQGARAVAAEPLTRVTGHVSSQGLVLFEVAIGTSLAALRSRASAVTRILLLGLLTCRQAAGMHHTAVAVRQRATTAVQPAHVPPDRPETLRIWTYTCASPTDVPFTESPDVAWLSSTVASTNQGIPPAGDYVWTVPRLVQGVAHVLHLPPGTSNHIFWLLHFRARGHVVAGSLSSFDWSYIGTHAAEAFGEAFFSQGHFGLFINGQLTVYGTHLQAPPQGAILHLVRTSLQPASGASLWGHPRRLVFHTAF